MKDQPIKLATAQLLKKTDFKEYCTDAYVNREYLCEYHIAGDTFYKYTCKEDFPLVEEAVSFMVPRSEPYFAAPTQTLLQQWFRKHCNIHISIYPLTDKDKMYGWRINVYEILPHKYIYRDNSNQYLPFKEYEDGLEVALTEALNYYLKLNSDGKKV